MNLVIVGLFCSIQLIPSTTFSATVEIQILAEKVGYELGHFSNGRERNMEDLYRRVESLIANINKTIQEIDSSEKELNRTLEHWSRKNNLQLDMRELTVFKSYIDNDYMKLEQYLKENRTQRIADLAEVIVQNGASSVGQMIGEIQSYLLDPIEGSENVVNRLLKYLQPTQEETFLCSLPMFPQQIIYSYFQLVMVAEIKCYVLQVFAYNYYNEETQYEEELREAESTYSNQTESFLDYFQEIIKKSSRSLWKCGPAEEPEHTLDVATLNEENLPNDRYLCKCGHKIITAGHINLRVALADFRNNRVVTGLRFVKNNSIIHLQVQDGKLLPFAKIEDSSLQWVPVNNYAVTDRKVYEGQDYQNLTYKDGTLDLIDGDVVADPGYVIIGVRFKKTDEGRVQLQILQVPFNFTSGVLHQERQFKDSTYDGSSESSLPNSFLNTPVVSVRPVPLSGVGILHKIRRDDGGFIAPKIIAYDIADHITTLT